MPRTEVRMGTWLVTGASRGLGLEWVRQLAERGDTVIATARKPEKSRELGALRVETHDLDVSDERSIAALKEHIGSRPLDAVVNNAGVGGAGADFEHLGWDDVRTTFEVNAIGPMRIAQALWPNLLAGRDKLLVNVTSRMGSIADNGSGGYYAYRASKCALNMLTRTLALDSRRAGMTCVLLHPGWVATEMGGKQAPLTPQQSVEGMLQVVSRLGPPDTGRFFDWTGAELPW
jgi:NAD(P)-dependent dehydrogenase (short-subunit alcohol dehydrogenase family)